MQPVDFIEVNLFVNPIFPGNDILITELSEIGYNMFAENEQGFIAYTEEKNYNEKLLFNIIEKYKTDFQLSHEIKKIKNQNWNKTWEENFNPVIINDDCIIKAPFHTLDKKYKYEIIIQPQMSFGTGHHETTSLMVREMLNHKTSFEKAEVLDMGSGTGVLAVLAEKLGSKRILAIDIDEWAYNNALENTVLNNCKHIDVKIGDINLLQNTIFNVILANINLNVLLKDMPYYASSLQTGGLLFFSGILISDFDKLNAQAMNCGLHFESKQNLNDWLMCVFVKK